MNTKLFQKDFITTQDWTVEDLNTMLELAFRLKGEFAMGVLHDHILRAKTLYMLFFEESTRTRNSFETGYPTRRARGLFDPQSYPDRSRRKC
jgi:N-acetylornithine carbamoyltransferase